MKNYPFEEDEKATLKQRSKIKAYLIEELNKFMKGKDMVLYEDINVVVDEFIDLNYKFNEEDEQPQVEHTEDQSDEKLLEQLGKLTQMISKILVLKRSRNLKYQIIIKRKGSKC